MNPSFTRFWARILVAVGLALAASGVFLAAVALVIDMPWGSITGHAVAEVTLVAFFLAVSGVLAGVPFIVLGQVVLVFLDMHALLERIVVRLDQRAAPERVPPTGELPGSVTTLTIVADDLTGGCDTGTLFAGHAPVPLAIWPRTLPAGPVRVIDTESRALAPGDAAERVRSAAAGAPATHVFKKIDSTLRGRIGAETEALMAARGLSTALLCPAFPAQRRIIVNRMLAVDGAPVSASAVATDPEFPAPPPLMRSAAPDVLELLGAQFERPLAWVSLDRLRRGTRSLRDCLTRLAGNVILADAETDADLDALATAALASEPVLLLVGSAGLAGALARRLGWHGKPVALPSARRWLIVAGSRHPATRRQAAAAREARLFVITPADADGGDRAVVARSLAAEARRLLDAEDIDLVAVTGGETAVALFEALGASRIDLVGAPRPGLALGYLPLSGRPALPVVTKAGGFGEDDLFVSLARSSARLAKSASPYRGVSRLRRGAPSVGGMGAISGPPSPKGDHMTRPILGITMGDPAGVGPEIIARAAAEAEVVGASRPVVIGDASVMREALRLVDSPLALRPITDIAACRWPAGALECLDLGNVEVATLPRGEVSAAAGRAAHAYILCAVDLATSKAIDGIVTAPINKEALAAAGVPHTGHTEILAELSNTRDYAMLLMGKDLKVIHVTTHVSLRRVPDLVTRERVLRTIRLAEQTMKGLGQSRPRIAVCGLNPHAGEDGLFGDEEKTAIGPAIEAARAEGLEVHGPLPADTLFSRARGGEFDIVVAMYHDQGHIPVKTVGFTYDDEARRWTGLSGVNVTVGLPFLRVSVDHGTAFDRAWKGIANAESMIEAIEVAVRMLARRG